MLPRSRGITQRTVEIWSQFGLYDELTEMSLPPAWCHRVIYAEAPGGQTVGEMPSSRQGSRGLTAYCIGPAGGLVSDSGSFTGLYGIEESCAVLVRRTGTWPFAALCSARTWGRFAPLCARASHSPDRAMRDCNHHARWNPWPAAGRRLLDTHFCECFHCIRILKSKP